MGTLSSIRNVVESARPGTLFENVDFEGYGSRTAIESALSRLARSGSLSRVRRGIYFRSAESRFGSGGVSSVAAALKVARGRAAGPSGAAAAAMLGLSTQMPAVPEIAVVGRPPTSIPGVLFRERSNTMRVAMNLRPKEIAVLELAREKYASVEVPMSDLRGRLAELVSDREIDGEKLKAAAQGESRAVRHFIAELFPA